MFCDSLQCFLALTGSNSIFPDYVQYNITTVIIDLNEQETVQEVYNM